MPNTHNHTYKVDNMIIIVTPVYQQERGEKISDILLKLMKADAGVK